MAFYCWPAYVGLVTRTYTGANLIPPGTFGRYTLNRQFARNRVRNDRQLTGDGNLITPVGQVNASRQDRSVNSRVKPSPQYSPSGVSRVIDTQCVIGRRQKNMAD